MNDQNIVQIIQAPSDMLAEFKQGDGSFTQWRVVCLALVDDFDGEEGPFRAVVPMVSSDFQCAVLATEYDNYVGFRFRDEKQNYAEPTKTESGLTIDGCDFSTPTDEYEL